MSETNSVKIVIGVDTHKDVYVAGAINGIGARLGTLTIPEAPKAIRTSKPGREHSVRSMPLALRVPDRMERVSHVFCRRRGIPLSK
jgi:hypothetical protein